MSSRLRLLRLALQTPPQSNNPSSVPGSAPAFIVASRAPTAYIGWGTANIPILQQLISVLNIALHTLSNGDLDFTFLFDQHFNTDLSEYSYLVMFLANFGKILFNQVLTNYAKPFDKAVPAEDRKSIVNQLILSLQNPVLPDDAINQLLHTKIGGNLKALMEHWLRQIKI